MTMKLGKKPHVHDPRDLRFDSYLTATLPPAPAVFGHEAVVHNWGMLGNDRVGDCVAEGSLVPTSGIKATYRIPYRGPLLTLVFASGKKLTVTPNHAVLTPRGFIKARFLKQGDDAIGASGSEILASVLGGNHLDHAPAPIEQVFATLQRRARGAGAPVLVLPAVDLHGDEQFVHGDVDVVAPDGLLQREGPLAALGKPHGEKKVGTTGERERVLHGDRPALQPRLTGRSSMYGGVSGANHLTSLVDREARVSQGESGALGPDLYPGSFQHLAEAALVQPGFFGKSAVALSGPVSVDERREIESGDFLLPAELEGGAWSPNLVAGPFQPSSDGGTTDAELGPDLLKRFPGLVATEHIVDIDVQFHETHVYDLSTESRWFTANEIVAHNCVLAGAAHEVELWTRESNTHADASFTDANVLSDYSAITGYNPADPNTDQGTDMRAAADYRRKTGIVDAKGHRHKVAAYVALSTTNVGQLAQAIYLFGAVGIGIAFPSSAMTQFNAGKPWDYVPGAKIEGGHYIAGVGRAASGNFLIVTWGKVIEATPRFLSRYMDEGLAYLSTEALEHSVSLEGFNVAQLQADLASL